VFYGKTALAPQFYLAFDGAKILLRHVNVMGVVLLTFVRHVALPVSGRPEPILTKLLLRFQNLYSQIVANHIGRPSLASSSVTSSFGISLASNKRSECSSSCFPHALKVSLLYQQLTLRSQRAPALFSPDHYH